MMETISTTDSDGFHHLVMSLQKISYIMYMTGTKYGIWSCQVCFQRTIKQGPIFSRLHYNWHKRQKISSHNVSKWYPYCSAVQWTTTKWHIVL